MTAAKWIAIAACLDPQTVRSLVFPALSQADALLTAQAPFRSCCDGSRRGLALRLGRRAWAFDCQMCGARRLSIRARLEGELASERLRRRARRGAGRPGIRDKVQQFRPPPACHAGGHLCQATQDLPRGSGIRTAAPRAGRQNLQPCHHRGGPGHIRLPKRRCSAAVSKDLHKPHGFCPSVILCQRQHQGRADMPEPDFIRIDPVPVASLASLSQEVDRRPRGLGPAPAAQSMSGDTTGPGGAGQGPVRQ